MPFFAFHLQLLPTLSPKIKSLQTKRLVAFCLLLLSLVSLPQIASADIFEWEWVNLADHSQGKQQSTTLVPDGAGLVPAPGLNAEDKNLTQAYLRDANLTNAYFEFTTLTNADFTNAEVRGANFRFTTDSGFTAMQLYSTASYQAGNLTGIGLGSTDLTDWNFAGQNLTNADFFFSRLANADFTNAEVRGADFARTTGFTAAQLYSTASYQAGDLTGVSFNVTDLTGWNFGGLNLTDVRFYAATLANANFTNAEISGAELGGNTDFTTVQLYSTASYQAGDLTGVSFYSNDLTGWNFAGQNLTNADFPFATLTNADFTNAEVRGANLGYTTDSGFTAAQLYSTASYQLGDLTGVHLRSNDLTGWNFAGQNLTNTSFSDATLTNVDFTNAEIHEADFGYTTGFAAAQLYSTASYQLGDLTGVHLRSIDLTGWNFVGQNLSDANFSYATLPNANLSGANLTNADFPFATLTNADLSGANLTDAYFFSATLTNVDLSGANLTGARFYSATLTNTNFTNTEVRGANFINSTNDSGFTATQLYSTASYQAGNLTGIRLGSNDLTGWNFVGQNLTNAYFKSATLTNANFSRADARLALFMNLSSTITHNFIHPDGHVEGLDITASEVMRLWDFDSYALLSILVKDVMSVASAGTLRVVFEDEDWGSLITFEAGISVSLDGTLELLVEPDEETDLASLVGTTFALFDWTGVTPTGTFSQIITNEGFDWDTSDLYTTGVVTLLNVPEGLPGDYDTDNDVDGADFLAWQRGGSPNPLSTEDLASWQQAYGQTDSLAASQPVPEPSTVLLLAMSGVVGLLTRKSRNRKPRR